MGNTPIAYTRASSTLTTSISPVSMSIDFSRYTWQTSADGTCHREAAGGELMENYWRSLGYGDYVLIFAAELAFVKAINVEALLQRAQVAWGALRYDVPTMAAHTIYDGTGRTHITYTPAASADVVKGWAMRTVRLRLDFKNVDEFRRTLALKQIRDPNGDQTFLYIVPHPQSTTAYSMLLHTSHITFDAKGLQILFARFMQKFSKLFDGHSFAVDETLQWGTESKNLLPAPYDILGPGETREGPVYEETLKLVMDHSVATLPLQRGFRPRVIDPSSRPHVASRASVTLSAQDSRAFFAKVRSLGLTVNHVCHAAVTLVCADDNPLSAIDTKTSFVYRNVTDARHRLLPEYATRDGYPGFCLAVSPIQIPASVVWDGSLEGQKERLIRISNATKEEYLKQKAYRSLLAISPQYTELLLSGIKTGPPAAPTTAPWYSGDGKGEQHIDPIYDDMKGDAVVEITSFYTSVNKLDPAPFFRVWSWRDRLTLSVDYNENSMPTDTVDEFVRKWVELVSLLV